MRAILGEIGQYATAGKLGTMAERDVLQNDGQMQKLAGKREGTVATITTKLYYQGK